MVKPLLALPPLLRCLAVVAAAVALAMVANRLVPVLSPLTVAMLIGVAVGNSPLLTSLLGPGWQSAVASVTRAMLRVAVVLLGLQLAVPQVLQLGAATVLAVVATVVLAFLSTLALGRLLGLGYGVTVLIATGFSICGASAIAAMEGVVRRTKEDTATALTMVTLFGTLAIVALPLLGSSLGLSAESLGTWAGLSVHEVAQVVAAASPAGAAAVTVAVLVKLTRVVLLAPMVAVMSVLERRRSTDVGSARPPLVPLFVLGFLAMVTLASTGLVPAAVLEPVEAVTTLLLAGALFGLGCGVQLRPLLRTGGRAVLLGLCSTVVVTGFGYAAVTAVHAAG